MTETVFAFIYIFNLIIEWIGFGGIILIIRYFIRKTLQDQLNPTAPVIEKTVSLPYLESDRTFPDTRIKRNVDKFMVDNRIYENIDKIAKYLMSHPVLLTICTGIIATLIIPVLLFIIFAIVNVAFAFTGFVVVVVAVLTIGATVLCSLMFSIIMTIAMIGICLVLSWSLSCYMLSVLRNFKVVP